MASKNPNSEIAAKIVLDGRNFIVILKAASPYFHYVFVILLGEMKALVKCW